VVDRFLVEYLQNWNGRDYFLEILRLLSVVAIADFDGEAVGLVLCHLYLLQILP
jgi:hypothetical protein